MILHPGLRAKTKLLKGYIQSRSFNRINYNTGMQINTIFFDLDGTLYSNETGLWYAIRERMNQYMLDALQLPVQQVAELRRHYYVTYGTTLRGLQRHYSVDADAFLDYVHDLPLHEYLRPQPDIAAMITALPQRKFIFTNADDAHACRVLRAMGLEGLFEKLIDVRMMGFHCKPELEAYRIALEIAGNPQPQACMMIDDSERNLEPAKSLGFTTIHVNHNGQPSSSHLTIRKLCELKTALPFLWN